MNDQETGTAETGAVTPFSQMVTASEMLEEIIGEHQKKAKAGQEYVIYIHPQIANSAKLGATIKTVKWEEWDEATVANQIPPGKYHLAVRAVGIRGFLSTVSFDNSRSEAPPVPGNSSHVPGQFPAPAIGPNPGGWPGFPPPGSFPGFYPYPPSAAPAPAPGGGLDASVIVAMIQSQAAQAGHTMQMLTTLLTSNKGPTLGEMSALVNQRTPVGELVQLLDVVSNRGGGGGGGDGEGADILTKYAPLISMLGPVLDGFMRSRNGQPPAPAPSQIQVKPVTGELPVQLREHESAPSGVEAPGQTEAPPHSPEATPPQPDADPTETIKKKIADILTVAAMVDGNPETYADALLDVFDLFGVNVGEMVAQPHGMITATLIAMGPELGQHRAYIIQVENAIRKLHADGQTEAVPETPTNETVEVEVIGADSGGTIVGKKKGKK